MKNGNINSNFLPIKTMLTREKKIYITIFRWKKNCICQSGLVNFLMFRRCHSDQHYEGWTNGSDYLLFCKKISEFARGQRSIAYLQHLLALRRAAIDISTCYLCRSVFLHVNTSYSYCKFFLAKLDFKLSSLNINQNIKNTRINFKNS